MANRKQDYIVFNYLVTQCERYQKCQVYTKYIKKFLFKYYEVFFTQRANRNFERILKAKVLKENFNLHCSGKSENRKKLSMIMFCIFLTLYPTPWISLLILSSNCCTFPLKQLQLREFGLRSRKIFYSTRLFSLPVCWIMHKYQRERFHVNHFSSRRVNTNVHHTSPFSVSLTKLQHSNRKRTIA